MVNNRIFYAIQQAAIKDNSAAPTSDVTPLNAREFSTGSMVSGVDQVSGLWQVPRGVQSVGMTTNFNTEQVFELGQVELYEFSERQPDIEVTLSKAIDGSKPLFFMVTDPTRGNDLIARTSDYRIDVSLQIYPDSQFRATGRPLSIVTNSGMYVSSVSYAFPTDGFVTEDITLVGNDKIWGAIEAITGDTDPVVIWPDDVLGNNPGAPEGLPSGVFGNDGLTSADLGGIQELAGGFGDIFGVRLTGSGIQRREEIDIRRSILPSDIPGVVPFVASGVDAAFISGFGAMGPGTAAGENVLVGNGNTDGIIEHIQNITVSASIGRRDIFELGSKRPFAKVVEFPVEVTTSIEVTTSQGDFVDATSDVDCGPDNTSPSNTIIIRTCDGLQVDLGDSNRLVSIDVSGGDAGGDDVTITYNYTSFNVFNVSHDFFQPNHRVVVFDNGSSRFNVGAPDFGRDLFFS